MAKEPKFIAKIKANKSLRRIRTLLKIQSKDKFSTLKDAGKKKLAFKFFITFCVFALITFIIFTVLGYLKNTFKIELDANLLITVLFFSQVIAVISSMSNILDILYSNKENMLLLAFPCKVYEIFTSKLLIFLLREIKRSVFFTLPFLIAFGSSSAGISWPYWVLMPIAWLMIVTFVPLIATFVSVAVLYTKRFLQKHSFIYAFLLTVFLALCFYACYAILGKLPTPIRLVAIYDKFVTAVAKFTAGVAVYANIYTFIGRMLFSDRVYLYLPVLLAILFAFTALVYLTIMPFYFKAISTTAEYSTKKKFKSNISKSKNIYGTFLRKELILLRRDPSKINGILSLCMLLPIVLYVMNFILQAISKNTLGEYIVVAFNIMITLTLLSTYNSSVAAAFSEEGSEFAVLKSAPAKTMYIGWAKMTVSAVVDVIALVVVTVLLTFITDISDTNLACMFFSMLFLTLGHVLWSCQLDVNNPKFAEYAAKGGAVTDNGNIGRAMFYGFLMSTLTGILSLIIMMDNFTTSWARILIIAVLFFVARFYLYWSNLRVYYYDMEM